MTIILHIETATPVCSVALSIHGELICIEESKIANSHSSSVTVFIQKVINNASIDINDLDAVAVSKGPGSYTGLRIGVSTAKGLCYSIDKPLIAISTLQAMANGMKNQKLPENASSGKVLFCPMIDARRMEVYTAFYNHTLIEIKKTSADIISNHSYKNYLSKYNLIFAGNGSDKCKTHFASVRGTFFLENFNASAKYMIPIAVEKYKQSEFELLQTFEPYYLKDFVAGKPKIKGLKTVD